MFLFIFSVIDLHFLRFKTFEIFLTFVYVLICSTYIQGRPGYVLLGQFVGDKSYQWCHSCVEADINIQW